MFTSLFTSLPLALDGTIYAACAHMRKISASASTGVTSAAMTLACIIVLFLMIKMSHDLMSDEQQSGFGGITLWQLCRPIIILIAIFNFSLIDGAVNGVCNYIASSVNMSADIDAVSQAANKNTKRKAALANMSSPIIQEMIDKYGPSGADTDNYTPQMRAEYNMKLANADYKNKMENGNFVEKVGAVFGKVTNISSNSAIISGYLGRTTIDSHAEVDANGNVVNVTVDNDTDNRKWYDKIGDFFGNFNLTNFVLVIYKYVFPVVVLGGEILLCVLVFFGPWALCLSLLPWSRNAFTSFIMTYLQVCCWKPIASIVNWVTVNMIQWINANEVSAYNVSNIGSLGLNIGAADFLLIVVAIAGIKTMLKVPAIAAMVIPGGTSAGDAGGAGLEVGAAMISEAKNAPKKAVGFFAGKK